MKRLNLNKEEDLKEMFNSSLDEVWQDFVFCNTASTSLQKCSTINLPNEALPSNAKTQFTVNINNNHFGAIMIEFKENNQFFLNSAPEFLNLKMIAVPSRAE